MSLPDAKAAEQQAREALRLARKSRRAQRLRRTLQEAVHQVVVERRAQQVQTPSPLLEDLEAELDESLTSLRHQPLESLLTGGRWELRIHGLKYSEADQERGGEMGGKSENTGRGDDITGEEGEKEDEGVHVLLAPGARRIQGWWRAVLAMRVRQLLRISRSLWELKCLGLESLPSFYSRMRSEGFLFLSGGLGAAAHVVDSSG